MIKVGEVFISDDSRVRLRVLSYTGEGVGQDCYCLLETDEHCWNGYHSALHIKANYKKAGGTNEYSRS